MEKQEERTPPPPAEPGGAEGTIVVEFVDVNQWPAFVAAWTAAGLPGAGKVQRTPNRVGLLQQRLADDDWRARWPEALARAGRSAKLRGMDPTWPSGLRLDTFLKDPDMLVRVLEGEFDDVGSPARPAPQPGYTNWRAAEVNGPGMANDPTIVRVRKEAKSARPAA